MRRDCRGGAGRRSGDVAVRDKSPARSRSPSEMTKLKRAHRADQARRASMSSPGPKLEKPSCLPPPSRLRERRAPGWRRVPLRSRGSRGSRRRRRRRSRRRRFGSTSATTRSSDLGSMPPWRAGTDPQSSISSSPRAFADGGSRSLAPPIGQSLTVWKSALSRPPEEGFRPRPREPVRVMPLVRRPRSVPDGAPGAVRARQGRAGGW